MKKLDKIILASFCLFFAITLNVASIIGLADLATTIQNSQTLSVEFLTTNKIIMCFGWITSIASIALSISLFTTSAFLGNKVKAIKTIVLRCMFAILTVATLCTVIQFMSGTSDISSTIIYINCGITLACGFGILSGYIYKHKAISVQDYLLFLEITHAANATADKINIDSIEQYVSDTVENYKDKNKTAKIKKAKAVNVKKAKISSDKVSNTKTTSSTKKTTTTKK